MARIIQNALQKILDDYSNFDYKESFTAVLPPHMPPQWVPADEERRLRSYTILESYTKNVSRDWLQALTLGAGEVKDAQKNRREYGDPDVLVETALSSLIGSSTAIVTQGAVDGSDPNAVLQQEALQEWTTRERFQMKLWECERSAVKLGDGVYVLGWDSAAGRPRLNVYDPGFYFPVFDPLAGGGEDFPNKVHIAWEFKVKNDANREDIFVRRITWELIDVEPYDPGYDAPAQVTKNVVYSDGVWELGDIGKGLESFSPERVQWIQEAVLLDLDFIPVVHLPNTINLQGHFGKSVLANVLQILDDVQATDTDIQASASTTGSPPIVVSGKGVGSTNVTSYGPGTVMYVGDGSASIMDTSTSLDALLKLKDALLQRLSINSRTPESLLGRVKPNEVPSGIALTLSFTPHIGMIREMRMVRLEKYSLMFKFVVRMMQKAGMLPRYAPVRSDFMFGSFLPADKQETMTQVQNLYTSKAISLETAVQMLIESGYPVEDWLLEIERIQSRDFEGANSIMVLSGDPDRALEYLGMAPSEVDMDLTAPDDEDDDL